MLRYAYWRFSVPKKRITVTVDEPVAEYLAEVPNTSAVVCEAVQQYRDRELQKQLEAAYREDAAESAEINAEWEPADAEVDE
jgi:hypothetical protein